MQRRCSKEMRDAGMSYPRTCQICALGPCRYYKEPGAVDTDGVSPWLQTINPERELRRFDLVNPTAAMVNFPAMARVLARIPRFGGHTEDEEIYSVAQHSVEGAFAILRDTGNREAARAFLLHDGHEYLIGDIATPVVKALSVHAEMADGFIAGLHVVRAIKKLKDVLDRVIYGAAGIAWPLPPDVAAIVKEYDGRMGRTELDARMDEPPCAHGPRYMNAKPVEGVDLSPMSQKMACGRFLAALGVFDINWSE